MKAAKHITIWNVCDEDGNSVNAGIYLLRMETENETQTIRVSVPT